MAGRHRRHRYGQKAEEDEQCENGTQGLRSHASDRQQQLDYSQMFELGRNSFKRELEIRPRLEFDLLGKSIARLEPDSEAGFLAGTLIENLAFQPGETIRVPRFLCRQLAALFTEDIVCLRACLGGSRGLQNRIQESPGRGAGRPVLLLPLVVGRRCLLPRCLNQRVVSGPVVFGRENPMMGRAAGASDDVYTIDRGVLQAFRPLCFSRAFFASAKLSSGDDVMNPK